MQNNSLEGFTFQESEKALCFYLKKERSDMYVFAVCKEALNGDIIHERDIYVAKETGCIYRKDEDILKPLKMDFPKGIQLPDITRNVWNWKPEAAYSEDGTSFQIVYGECTFFDRRYHEVDLVESSDMHVHIVRRYYIDVYNGRVYEEPEDWYTDSEIALHYVGNIEI